MVALLCTTNQVQGSIFIGLTGLKFCYDCPLLKTIVAFGILDVVLLGAGAALFATGIVTNNADLTLSGIVLLAMAIVTTVILYFIAPKKGQDVTSTVNPGMKRNKSDTDLELMRENLDI